MKDAQVVDSAQTPEPLSIKQNTLFNTVGSIAYQGCLWLTTVLVVVLSDGYYDSGILAFAMAIANMFNPIATYSMRIYQVSDVDNKYSQPNYVAFRIATIIGGFAFILPYTIIVATDQTTIIASLIYLLFKTDEAFCDVLYGIDQRGMRMDYIGISQLMRGILLVAAFAILMASGAGLIAAIAGMFLSCLTVTLLYDIPRSRRFGQIHPTISRKAAMRLAIECLPIVIATLFVSMVVAVPRQYYGTVRSIDALGIYAAIATPAVLIQACARYFYSPALVPLALEWSKSQNAHAGFLKLFLKTGGTLAFCVLLMVVALSLVGAPSLVVVFGPNIEPFTYLFPFVLIGTGLIAVEWYLADTLVILRDLKGLLMTNAAAFVISSISMIPLIEWFDMNGINFAIIISMGIAIVVASLRIRSKLSHKNG